MSHLADAAIVKITVFCLLVVALNSFDLESKIELNDERTLEEDLLEPIVVPDEPCESITEVQQPSLKSSSVTLKRKKRAIIAWPIRTKFTAEVYYAIPLYAPSAITIPIAFGIPFTFDIPNSTDKLAPRKRSIDDRVNIYGLLEGLIQNFGFDGRVCLQRAICERSEHNFLTTGILSELVNLILRVSSTSVAEGLWYDYVDAEKQGRKIGNCQERYATCPFSIFDFLGSF